MTHLVSELEHLGLGRTELDKLNVFIQLFSRWNDRINLSAAATPAEIAEHIRDSLHVVPYLGDVRTVIDVGSGGGFPAVVAAICLPEVQFTALEPVHKKHAFLRTAARELGLPNLSAFARRLEDHAERDYDAATSRATFDLREWILRGLELVRVGGRVFGFEATRREDLPAPFERHTYDLDGKRRSILVITRSS